jgi:hypothetical protein
MDNVFFMIDNEIIYFNIFGDKEFGYYDHNGNHYIIDEIEIPDTGIYSNCVYIHVHKID